MRLSTMRAVTGVAMTVFAVVATLTLFAIVLFLNMLTALHDSVLLSWDVGERMLRRAWGKE
jgi:hypothetical protein